MTIELRFLGPMQLGPDETPIPLGGTKQRSVLALLAVEFGRAVDADAMADAIWRTDALPEQPRRTIQVYVANLRKLLRPRSLDIVGTPNGYRLTAERATIDRCRFEDLVTEASALTAADPPAALALYRSAEALWRGRPFVGIDIDELTAAAERLEALRVAATEARLGLEVAGPDRPQAIEALRRFVADHPYREQAAAHLMTGLYLEHRHPEAVKVLEALRNRLADIGLEVSPSLGELELQILRHEVDERPSAPETAPSAGTVPTSGIPHLVSRFVGRSAELVHVTEACAAARWVTLVGPGGVGKTRLAVEVAGSGRVTSYFAGLAGTDADGVIPAIVRSTGLPVVPGCRIDELVGALAERLADSEAMLVLDNAEHVAERVVDVAGALLRAIPGLRVMVTSRDTLGVPGESTVVVEPLPDDDALALFADRAGLTGRTAVDLGTDDAVDQVRQLCRALDNLPLAIEMAATRTRILQVSEMVARIDDRFALLATEMRSELSNHRTLRGTIEWSYDRLSPVERTVFDRLAAFPSGCTLEAAEAVVWVEGDPFPRRDLIELLSRSVDRSMITADQSAMPTRFRMLATVRQFGLERFAVSPAGPAVRRSFATWALRIVLAAYSDSLGARPDRSKVTVETEIDNIRAAFEIAVADELPEALEIANWIAYLRMTRGESELGLNWLERACPVGGKVGPDGPVAARRAYADVWIVHSTLMLGRPRPGASTEIEAATDALRRTADGELLASGVLLAASYWIHLTDDSQRGLALADEIAARFDHERDPLIVARSRGLAALAHLRLGDIEQARSLAHSSRETLLSLPSEVAALHQTRILISIAWRMADHAAVRELGEWLSAAEERFGHVAYDYTGSYWLAALAAIEGDHERAAELMAAELARPALPATRPAVVALQSLLLRRSGDADAALTLVRGAMPERFHASSTDGATIYAERGWCELTAGAADAAEHFFGQSVAYGTRSHDPVSQAAGLEGRAAVALARGDRPEAEQLLHEADELRAAAPARSNLHQPEVDDLRSRWGGPARPTGASVPPSSP